MYIRREREFFNERAHHTGPVEEAHARVWVFSREFRFMWKRVSEPPLLPCGVQPVMALPVILYPRRCPSRGWIFSWTTEGAERVGL